MSSSNTSEIEVSTSCVVVNHARFVEFRLRRARVRAVLAATTLGVTVVPLPVMPMASLEATAPNPTTDPGQS
jgi:hypothetical protein